MNTMLSSVTVSVNPLPNSTFALSGGGTYCSPGENGRNVILSGSQTGVNYQLKVNGSNSGGAVAGTGGSLTWSNLTTVGSYTIVGTIVSTGCSASMTGSVSISTTQGSIGGSVLAGSPTVTEAFNSISGTVALTGQTGNVVKWQSSPDGTTWTDISNTSTVQSYNLSSQSSPYYINFRVVVQSGSCPVANSLTIFAAAHPGPTISTQAIAIGASAQLTQPTSSILTSIQWQRGAGNTNITGATSWNYTATEPDLYRSQVVTSHGNTIYGPLQLYSIGSAPGTNSQTTTVVRKAGLTSSSNLYSLQPGEYKQAISYDDGLGRNKQQVGVGLSPSQLDIVQPLYYNQFGQSDVNYLPYVDSLRNGQLKSDGLYTGAQYTTSKQYKFYRPRTGLNRKIATDSKPYAVTIYEAGPLTRVTEQGAAGVNAQPGTTHTVQQSYSLNNATDNVRQWTAAGPGSGGSTYYSALSLVKSVVTDENGNQTITFADKLGRTILKRVQSGVSSWLETYYVYDDRNNLILQVPPKAMALINSGTTWTQPFQDAWCFTYTYDYRNRLVEKKRPGVASIYYCYDPLDRLVLTQDGNLRATNRWVFVKYDIKGRPVMTGTYTNTTYATRPTLQQSVLDGLYSSGVYYEERGTALHGYTNQSFPTQNSDATALVVWSASYYDTYDFDFNGSDDWSYTSQGLTGEATQGNSFMMPTGSKQLVMGTANWLYSYMFYDKYGRVIQLRTNNHLSATVDNLVTNVLDFEGKLLTKKTYHNAGGTNQTTVINKYTYDVGGRLIKVYQNNNSAPSDQLVAQYEYNELGQVVDKKLHDNGGGTFLQSVDYRYHIRAWLKSINNAQLKTDSRNDDVNDFFGMELQYDSADTGIGSTAAYNGNISAMKWKTLGEASGPLGQRGYSYLYDKSDRLTSSTFKAYGTSAWDQEVNTLDEALTYDENGNIVSLSRKYNLRGLSGITVTSSAQFLDNLMYTYATGNQLSKVEDSGTTGGFNNGASITTEYTYTTDGSLTSDSNKGISTITYNDLGKVSQITYSGSPAKTVTYTYSASGTKVKMVTYDGTTTTTTDYIAGFVYVNTALSFFASPEGRVVKNGSTLEYQYAITDHQGNTRLLFSSQTPAPLSITATFEGDANDQAGQFLNVNVSNVISFIGANHTSGGSKVVRMNQTYAVGPSKSLKVYAGDKVDMEVWSYYETTTGYGTSSPGLATMVTAIASAFGGVSGGPGESGSIYSGVNSALTGYGLDGNAGDTAPAAYINYILFDRDYKVLHMGFTRVPSGSMSKQKISIPQVAVKQAGYIFVYLSYEDLSNNYVYFDDFKVTHTKNNIIQFNAFYSFGMQAAESWIRENATLNNLVYNGPTETNATTGWDETFFRSYDPVLGRFLQVDPVATLTPSGSPYRYANDNPLVFNDPSGLFTDSDFNDVVSDLRNSKKGGSWRGGKTAYYTSDVEAFVEGSDAITASNGWGGTTALNYAAAALAFRNATGIMPLTGVTVSSAFGVFGGEPYSSANWLNRRLRRADQIMSASLEFWTTMANPIVQRIHQGQRQFMENPFGGGLMAFLTGGPMLGAGASLLGSVGGKVVMSASSKFVTQAATNLVSYGWRSGLINAGAQAIFKGPKNIDFADVGISAISGKAWMTAGVVSSLLDVSWENGVQTAFDKGWYLTLVDAGTGVLFNGANFGASEYWLKGVVNPGSVWATGVDAGVQIYGELFNWTLNQKPND